MALALRSGVPHTVWLDDPQAMVTAVDLIREQQRADKRRRR